MIQLQAGYIFDSIKRALMNNYPKEMTDGLLKRLSFFDIEVDSTADECDNTHIEQTLFVAHNILSRGLPTCASSWVENAVRQSVNQLEDDSQTTDTGSLENRYETDENSINQLFRALHLIDPALRGDAISQKSIYSWEDANTSFEADFLYHQIPAYLSEHWIQLIDSQRDLEELLRFSIKTEEDIDKYTNGMIRIANEQKVDFTIEYPYLINNSAGMIFEIDGSQHKHPEQKYTDNNRDAAAEKAGFQSIRVQTDQWDLVNEAISQIERIEVYPYFKTIRQNFEDPLYRNDDGLRASKVVLMPYAIARIQKTIIHLLLAGCLDINIDTWDIAVLERDIPCAQIALDDLALLLNALSALRGEAFRFPEIHLYIQSDPRFETDQQTPKKEIDKDKVYDLFIDISMLQRSGLTCMEPGIHAKTSVLIRSSHAIRTHVSFKTSAFITYKALGYKDKKSGVFEEDSMQVNILRTFVRDIFGKTDLKTEEVEMIHRMLQGKSAIGLLSDNSGQSLIYLMATLLRPGMSIVVSPDQSRMGVLYEDLRKRGIDCAVSIDCSLRQKKRYKATGNIKNAQTLFVFITPERLHDDLFRQVLNETCRLHQQHVSYCIIDEAHCVSEWGHDFKTSYIHLAATIQEHCQTNDKRSIPMIALTDMISYDVLSDIRQAFQINESSAVIRSDYPGPPKFRTCGSFDYQQELIHIMALLSEIVFPSRKITDYIEECVSDKFSVDVNLTLTVNDKNRQILSINPHGGSIYIDRDNLPFYMVHTPQSVKIADYIKQIILSEKPNEITSFDWLNQPMHSSIPAPGIERLLENSEIPDQFQVEIPFTKQQFFSEIQHKHAICKALYRLYIIGVIDDYTINDYSNIVLTMVTRKKQGYYTDRLRDYILRYDCPVGTDKKMKQLPFYKGDSEIQKCVHYLLRFINETTAQQQQTIADTMGEVHWMGLTDQGTKADFTVVEKYMDLVNTQHGKINQLKHLKAAASRLLVSSPDNFVFILLKSFSLFLTGKEDFMIEEAQTDFINGFLKERKTTGENAIRLKKKIDLFKQKVGELDTDVIEKVEEAENTTLLITHTHWLKEFNDNFINL